MLGRNSISGKAILAPDVKYYDFNYIGKNTVIMAGTKIGNFVHIDHDVIIDEDCNIESCAYICALTQIGKRVFIGPHVTFTNDFYPDSKRRFGKVKLIGARIEDDVVIGAGVVIGPGVVVGKEAVIGMGAVVTHNIPDYQVVVGNPAHIIYSRGEYNMRQREWQ